MTDKGQGLISNVHLSLVLELKQNQRKGLIDEKMRCRHYSNMKRDIGHGIHAFYINYFHFPTQKTILFHNYGCKSHTAFTQTVLVNSAQYRNFRVIRLNLVYL